MSPPLAPPRCGAPRRGSPCTGASSSPLHYRLRQHWAVGGADLGQPGSDLPSPSPSPTCATVAGASSAGSGAQSSMYRCGNVLLRPVPLIAVLPGMEVSAWESARPTSWCGCLSLWCGISSSCCDPLYSLPFVDSSHVVKIDDWRQWYYSKTIFHVNLFCVRSLFALFANKTTNRTHCNDHQIATKPDLK